MTDRFNGFFVILEKDIREDDAEAILTALGQIRGVIAVTPNVAGFDTVVAEERMKDKMRSKIYELWKGI